MLDAISVPTIMVCTFMAMVAISAAMAIVWNNNGRKGAAGYWTLAFMIHAIGGLFVANAEQHPGAMIPLSALFVTAGYSFFWGGFRAFNGDNPRHRIIGGAPLVMLSIYMMWPQLTHLPGAGIAMQSSVISVFSLASAYAVFTGSGNRQLPIALPAAIFLVIHGVLHLAHIPLAFRDLTATVGDLANAAWWKLMMLEAFMNIIISAITCIMLVKERSEARHRHDSETDALTGIANRRAFYARAETLLAAETQHAVLAVLDFDHFKRINDRNGHQAGDHALVEITRLISGNLPKGALFGRIGGEEFAILLLASTSRSAQVLEQLRDRAENTTIRFKDAEFRLSISIGAASTDEAGTDLDHLMAAADSALYSAKDHGRNRVTFFQPSAQLRSLIDTQDEEPLALGTAI
jgi:diguanylate cyclase (GGDEF)-like protein